MIIYIRDVQNLGFGQAFSNEVNVNSILSYHQEYKIAEETLKSCSYKVDYVLTNTVPQLVIHYLGHIPDMYDAELTGYFEWLYGDLKFQKWFAEHFHVSQIVRDNVQVLLDKILLFLYARKICFIFYTSFIIVFFLYCFFYLIIILSIYKFIMKNCKPNGLNG